jgi:hypothetical protein
MFTYSSSGSNLEKKKFDLQTETPGSLLNSSAAMMKGARPNRICRMCVVAESSRLDELRMLIRDVVRLQIT